MAFVVLFCRNLTAPLKGVVILADIRKTIGPLPQSICYPSGDPAVLCKGSSAFLIVDLTFHGQWCLFQVRRQPPCSGGFACLGSPLKICKLQRCRCLSLRWQVVQFVLKSLHPRLRNTCTSATNVFQAVSWIAVRKESFFLKSMPLDTRAEFEFPTVHHAMPCEILLQFVSPLFIGPIGPDLCAFPQQSCVSSVMFSIFSLARSPCATWRGAVAMSDMSDMSDMEFTWDICPFIGKSSKPRRRCRRRCSKTCLCNLLVWICMQASRIWLVLSDTTRAKCLSSDSKTLGSNPA